MRNAYPNDPDYEYISKIVTLDLDEEKKRDLENDNGFEIGPSNEKITKDLKDYDGIFSPRFGPTLDDVNTYMNRYKCKCGKLNRRISHGIVCPSCGEKCVPTTDNFEYFGWMTIDDPFFVLHPIYYKKIERFIGKKGMPKNNKKRSRLENILDIVDNKDINGNSVPVENTPKNEPFYGIGMIEFRNRFDEIMNYYFKLSSSKDKVAYYEEIMNNKKQVFTRSIPTYTSLLRPIDNKDGTLSYEDTNSIFVIMNKLRTTINRQNTRMNRNLKPKNINMYKCQEKYMELYDRIIDGLSGKKGDFRSLMGGRYNFTARDVIVQDPDLRIDEISLSYSALIIMMEQRIKNALKRLYNLSMAETHSIWYKSITDMESSESKMVEGIVQSIIDHYKSQGLPGIPMAINRNPTIGYGSVLQVYCKSFNKNYTMAISLQVLEILGADFDGDALNIIHIINETFHQAINAVFNPRNSFYISRDDGYFNTSVCVKRDTLINLNSLSRLNTYNPEEVNILRTIKDLNKEYF